MFAVPSRAVFCIYLISRFPGMLLRYCLNYFEVVPVTPIVTGITFFYIPHVLCLWSVCLFVCLFVVVVVVSRNCGLPLTTFQTIQMNMEDRRYSNGSVQLRYSNGCCKSHFIHPKSHINCSGSEIFRLGSLQPCYTDQTPYWRVLKVFFFN
jgi:hypothetical protein